MKETDKWGSKCQKRPSLPCCSFNISPSYRAESIDKKPKVSNVTSVDEIQAERGGDDYFGSQPAAFKATQALSL